jgi:hypothetical protein
MGAACTEVSAGCTPAPPPPLPSSSAAVGACVEGTEPHPLSSCSRLECSSRLLLSSALSAGPMLHWLMNNPALTSPAPMLLRLLSGGKPGPDRDCSLPPAVTRRPMPGGRLTPPAPAAAPVLLRVMPGSMLMPPAPAAAAAVLLRVMPGSMLATTAAAATSKGMPGGMLATPPAAASVAAAVPMGVPAVLPEPGPAAPAWPSTGCPGSGACCWGHTPMPPPLAEGIH